MTAVLSLWHGVLEARPSIRAIAEAVAAQHGLSLTDLISPQRRRGITLARHEAMWEIRRQTSRTFPEIGRLFNRHHTTVLNACRVHQQRLDAR